MEGPPWRSQWTSRPTTGAAQAARTVRDHSGAESRDHPRRAASFAEHGYERASLRDIAARANVTHAALLRHFARKDELLLAALAQRDADDEELARQHHAVESAG